ncbi:MAG TPA: hypothetical protein VEI02_11380, partial [Planctomycetota bacterium]|nr:hypothetical protein [Planctomycetota bacterium]
DGGAGYGHAGTLSWAVTWTTSYSTTSTVNAPANPAAFYQSQTSGMLAEITDSVFFRNNFGTAYTEATARGVFNASNNNVTIAGSADVDAPVQTLTRGAPVVKGGKVMVPVTFLDPRPKNAALSSVAWAPVDGFFQQARYRGAFAPGNDWLNGWTASQAFGLTPGGAYTDLGFSTGGVTGDPILSGTGTLTAGTPYAITLSNAIPNGVAILGASSTRMDLPFAGGVIVPEVFLTGFYVVLFTDGAGQLTLGGVWPAGVPAGFPIYIQYVVGDPAGASGVALSNALLATSG